ncbi:Gfo/Idh/MocA family protein [Pontiella sulfatireligans]|uniref:Inositol 2-dehydrogenase n=1 Tax=Pontiella sulfatireligans TaxID=2750658 RepID=A0A6C2UQZ0_9BACT|nr:Gfo/Idh/MocA family oxidoreductase [Pontiella sulfatireligans]VGO22722.1 Inositol 2-dehydrogenase [Pontiella sulfatireligans]
MITDTKRRTFLASTIATGAGLTLLPSGTLAGNGAGAKLNIALIGAYGRAAQHYKNLHTQNIVAICDVNADNMAKAAKQFPKAKQYIDWRKCLDQKDIEAVVICTPDHHHAFISIWAMNRGLHVYCEKPLGDCVMEARAVREVYLKNKNKLATQQGTQRHANPNYDRVAELVKGGAIGELKDVHAWGSRWHKETAYRPAAGPAPSTIDWEQWIGPTQMHPYNPEYFQPTRGPGSGCLQWNIYQDFGSWQVGDMGSHVMDLAWNAIDADRPTNIKADGDAPNAEVNPSAMRAIFEMPANDWRDEIRLVWYQGGPMPKSPLKALDLTKIGHGVMFKGSKGVIVSDFNNRMLIPLGKDTDMTYYKSPTPDQVAPPIGDFQQQWFNACKGDLKTCCDFDYSGRMVETLMLGLAAHQAGKELEYDAKTGTITNDPAANALLTKPYREGWVLNG